MRFSLKLKLCLSACLLAVFFPLVAPAEESRHSLEHDGITRSYHLHLPADIAPGERRPLIVGVHGYGGSGRFFEHEWAQIHDFLEQERVIGLFPDGLHPSANHGDARAFNDLAARMDTGPDGLTCDPPPFAYPTFDNCPEGESLRVCPWGVSCADDLGFFRELIEQVMVDHPVDKRRVYMVGYSQGGSTVHGLAPGLADLLTAVAPMHGFLANGYAHGPDGTLPYLSIWGRQDTVVRGDGLPSDDRLIYDGARESATAWAQSQACSTQTQPWSSAADGVMNWSCEAFIACADDSEVVLCAWDGQHVWPRSKDRNFAWEVIWPFFMSHVK